MTSEICLDGIWHFLPDPFNEGEVRGWHTQEYSAAAWPEVSLPTVFDRCHPELAGYEGAVWFRRTVFIPKEWESRQAILRFGAVNYHAKVWVNGQEVGTNNHGFLPFELLTRSQGTDALKYGADNTIVVCVDNERRVGEVPGMQRGWRPYGGILRTSSLVSWERLSLRVFFDYATLTAAKVGKVRLLPTIGVSAEGSEVTATLEVWIEDAFGNRVAEQVMEPVQIEGIESHTKEVEFTLPGVIPWSPESPTFYYAHFRLREGEKVWDKREIRFGFRSVSVQQGRICINDEPVLLYGFNRHEDSPAMDMAADPQAARQDLLRMKQMGANFIRLCHYPHDTTTLDLCDEIGLLVMEEIPLYWWNGHQEGEEAHKKKQSAAEQQITSLQLRDRHHPSIIFWSVSNETGEQRPEVAAGNAALVQLAKQLDPSRLATHVSDKWKKDLHFDDDDVISLNDYPTWGEHQFLKNPHYAPSEGGKAWEENLAKVREAYPNKPILISEFGYPALGGIHEGNISEETQAQTISEELSGILRCPAVCGATVWCWADHPWPEEPFINRITTSPFGVVARNRKSKAAFTVLERAFRGHSHRPSLVMRRANLENIPDPEALLASGYVLRTRRDDDLPKLADLMNRAFPEIGWDEKRTYNALIADETVKTTYVIEHGDTLVATASARWQPDRYPDEGYVHWVGADPEHRGKQLGLIVSVATLREFATWGAKGSILHTDDFRIPAIRVYLKLGFVPVVDHATHIPRWAKLRKALADYAEVLPWVSE